MHHQIQREVEGGIGQHRAERLEGLIDAVTVAHIATLARLGFEFAAFLGVIFDQLDGAIDFHFGLHDGLGHLQGDQSGHLVAVLGEQGGQLVQNDGTLGEGGLGETRIPSLGGVGNQAQVVVAKHLHRAEGDGRLGGGVVGAGVADVLAGIQTHVLAVEDLRQGLRLVGERDFGQGLVEAVALCGAIRLAPGEKRRRKDGGRPERQYFRHTQHVNNPLAPFSPPLWPFWPAGRFANFPLNPAYKVGIQQGRSIDRRRPKRKRNRHGGRFFGLPQGLQGSAVESGPQRASGWQKFR